MKLVQEKSKWLVCGDGGKVYSTHKSRKDAEEAKELQEAWNALANGWERLTDRQRELITRARDLEQ